MNNLTARLPRYAFYGLCGTILIFLVLPTLIAAAMSFSKSTYMTFPPRGVSLQWYVAYFNDPDWIAATLFSLKVAVLTAITSCVIGVMASIALERGRLPGKELINTLVLAPLIVPAIVVALGSYLQFARLHLIGTTLSFVLVHTALAVPYVVIMVSAAMQRIDFSLEMAALSLGASRTKAFFDVMVPLISPAIAAAAVFSFLASFDETTVSFFISGTENKTVTRKLFEDIDFNLSPIIAAVSTLFIVATVGLMALSAVARKKRVSASTEATA